MAMKPSSHSGCGREGCHSGVAMSDDTFFEGYERDVIYPPCACHPKYCQSCGGTGWAPEEIAAARDCDDCPDCDGSGWRGDPEHPDHRYADPAQWQADMATSE